MPEFWEPIAQNIITASMLAVPAVFVAGYALVRRLQRARRIRERRASPPTTTAVVATGASSSTAAPSDGAADVLAGRDEEIPDPWWWATAKDVARAALVAAFLALVLGTSLWFVWTIAGFAAGWARSGWNFFVRRLGGSDASAASG